VENRRKMAAKTEKEARETVLPHDKHAKAYRQVYAMGLTGRQGIGEVGKES
jgi:hypothetical protein